MNAERNARIVKMWNDDPMLSGTTIALELAIDYPGITRETILGVIARERAKGNVTRSGYRVKGNRKKPDAAKARNKSLAAMPQRGTSPALTRAMGEAILNRRKDQCKYPLGEGEAFFFCEEKRTGPNYCKTHHALCHNGHGTVKPRRKLHR